MHTPGPWEWWTSNSWRRLRHSDRGVSTNVLYPSVHSDGQADIDVTEDDMGLIAAAPEMLAAGVEIDRLILVIESAVRYADQLNHAEVLAALKANRAAIIKARTPVSR